MATAVNTIKLKTNIPLVGTVKYIDFAPTKNPEYSDQICVKGTFDGEGEGRVYLNLALEGEFKKIGLIGDKDARGNYPLKVQSPRIKLTRTENGRSKITTVEFADGTRPQPASPAQPSTTSHAPSYGSGQNGVVATWEKIVGNLTECYKAASKVMREGMNLQDDEMLDMPAVQACAATLFIAAGNKGIDLTSRPSQSPRATEYQMQQIGGLCGGLGYDDAKFISILASKFGVTDVNAISHSTAEAIIADLSVESNTHAPVEDIPF